MALQPTPTRRQTRPRLRLATPTSMLLIVLVAACGGAVSGDDTASNGTSANGSAQATPDAVGGDATQSSAASAGSGSAAAASGSAAAANSDMGRAAEGGAPAPSNGAAANPGGATTNEPVASGTAGATHEPAAGSGASEPVSGASGGGGPAAASGAEPASCKGDNPSAAPVVYIIGDSTASVYEASLYPRMGWAQPLQEYFKQACAKIQDKALSGRSSKSFLDEGAWTPIRAALHEGDFVLIQFGHNDEKTDDAALYTEPFGSYQQHLSMYIDDTLAAKATPILLTSIERNKWSNGKLSATHGDYPEAVRQLAMKRQITLVDMTQLTHAYLEGLGQAAATKLFMNLAPGESPNYPNGNSDDTHLQDKGAHKVAEIALAELARQRVPLAVLLDSVPSP